MDLKLYSPLYLLKCSWKCNLVSSSDVGPKLVSCHLLCISPHEVYFRACFKQQDACSMEILHFSAGESMYELQLNMSFKKIKPVC